MGLVNFSVLWTENLVGVCGGDSEGHACGYLCGSRNSRLGSEGSGMRRGEMYIRVSWYSIHECL